MLKQLTMLMLMGASFYAAPLPAGDPNLIDSLRFGHRFTSLVACSTVAGIACRTLTDPVVVQPGTGFSLDVQADLTGAQHVNLAVATTDPGNHGVLIGISFSANGTDWIITDIWTTNDILKYGSTVGVMGAARIPVYAPKMRVVVYNEDSKPLTVQQMLAYAITGAPQQDSGNSK
jgi:hypothetical protein